MELPKVCSCNPLPVSGVVWHLRPGPKRAGIREETPCPSLRALLFPVRWVSERRSHSVSSPTVSLGVALEGASVHQLPSLSLSLSPLIFSPSSHCETTPLWTVIG